MVASTLKLFIDNRTNNERDYKMSNGISNRIGQYLHADGAARRYSIGGTNYVIGIAGAYDAFGLIGPEHNGLFILNDDEKCVVLDRHCEESSGYHGPSRAQWAEFERVANLPLTAFRNFVKNHPRYRGN